MEIDKDTDNMYRWPSIGLTIQKFNCLLKENKKSYQEINDMIFKHPVFATVKYDGTNVGIDSDGLMYGRRKVIPKTTKAYQKTKLDFVQKIESK